MPRSSLVAVVASAVAFAQNSGTFQDRVRPVLAKYCYGCHGAKVQSANLNLEAAGEQPRIWEKVLDKLAASKMPPAGMPAPSKDERAAIETWASALPGVTSSAPDPGRITARRLNRAEYDNTIRDLLGVAARPAADFPADDSGYGFDNIGDVLSLPPMLMEKYLTAARRVARAAVNPDPPPATGSILAHYLGKRSGDAETGAGANGYLPYSMRGALYGSFVFPYEANYEFRFRVVDRRLDESRAVPVVLFMDDRPVFSGDVEGGRRGNYERGEYTARAKVAAGPHRFRVSFPHLAARDPRDNVAKDKIRKLFVEYLDIVGPFAPVKESGSYARVFACGHPRGSHKADCARTVVRDLARRAWRRSPSGGEVDRLMAIVSGAQREGDSLERGVQLALQALLSSSDFLFRLEPSSPGAAGPQPLDDFQLASRLSYFLWSSMPDEELMRLAREGKLQTPGALAAQAKRMLADPKSSALVENFAAQWLQLRGLARAKPDPARFPTADDELLESMRVETTAFASAIFREDRSIVDLVDAPFTFVNAQLARHYGIEDVNSEQFERVNLSGNRRGVLTHGSILTVSSYPTRTSPVIRGKWVLENVLGTPPPPPPPNVQLLEESKIDPNASFRKQLEQHRANPACAACHSEMDQIGFGFENYDAVGAWRTHEGKTPVDSAGTLPGGRSFQGPLDLIGILKAQTPEYARNFSEKLLTYALGRGLERYDRAAVDGIVQAAAREDYKFSAVVAAIVNSQPFRMRRAEGGK